jgi:8-oxo-dGTP pyrophosphatase MutT (NUDIX family)
VVDPENRLLLFRFEHRTGPLKGQAFWATPGGGLDPGETYEDAARRELFEETGLRIDDPGPQVARRQAEFRTPDGERVTADERFFVVRVAAFDPAREQWTELERQVMADHRWWSTADLRSTAEQVWPEDLPDLLSRAGVWSEPD